MIRGKVTRAAIVSGACLLLGVTATTAQQGPPKPGPEHQKLGYYVGKWTSETELKANPFMPAGKYTTVDDCQLFQGGFAVLCRSQGTSPLGPTAAVGIIGYSAEDKVYTYYGIDNNGMVPTTVAKGTIQGDTWTFNDESKFGGKLIKSRYSIKQLSPTSYSFRWEVQGDDGNWTAMMEGKSTKAP